MYPNVSECVKTGPNGPENVEKLREHIEKLRKTFFTAQYFSWSGVRVDRGDVAQNVMSGFLKTCSVHSVDRGRTAVCQKQLIDFENITMTACQ